MFTLTHNDPKESHIEFSRTFDKDIGFFVPEICKTQNSAIIVASIFKIIFTYIDRQIHNTQKSCSYYNIKYVFNMQFIP